MENIICVECNKEFTLEAKDIKTKAIDEVLITISFFECPQCHRKYIVSCTDSYIRKEQIRYQNITKDIQKLVRTVTREKKPNVTQYDKSIKELKDKKLRCLDNMKTYSDRLKEKVKDKL